MQKVGSIWNNVIGECSGYRGSILNLGRTCNRAENWFCANDKKNCLVVRRDGLENIIIKPGTSRIKRKRQSTRFIIRLYPTCTSLDYQHNSRWMKAIQNREKLQKIFEICGMITSQYNTGKYRNYYWHNNL